LSEGGTPPRFLIIDDGWQQIGNESKDAPASSISVQEGAQYVILCRNKLINRETIINSIWTAGIDSTIVIHFFRRFANRLTGIKENAKFQNKKGENEQNPGLKQLVDEVKQQNNVK
jgi:raffinose synthase